MRWIDGYDTAIHYMDHHIGLIIGALERQGVLDDTAIIVSADHGENQGELNIYGDHHTADHVTSHIPLIVRWPGVTQPRVDAGLLYNTDLSATVTELAGGTCSTDWDGESFADALRSNAAAGRDYLVLSQCAWSCQRSVRFDDHIMIRTWDDGLKDLPPYMLFNVADDPHEQHNLAGERPDLVNGSLAMMEDWHTRMMETANGNIDPLWTVMREGRTLPHARDARTLLQAASRNRS